MTFSDMAVATLSPAPQRKFSKNPFAAFYRSSIGKKIIVGITGLIWVLYVLGHLAGNLQIFLGQDRINAYAQFLQGLGPLLWAVRIILVVALVTHIVATLQLAQENRVAKSTKYAVPGYQRSTLASRTMVVTGLFVLCFVIYHILHFTLQVTHPQYRELHDSLGRHDVYRMLILSFSKPLISLFYILGVFFLGGHLSHGIASVTQTLGVNNRKLSESILKGGFILAWLVFAGYAVIPISVLLGFIKQGP
jgi:succinate dehydrogenase / fumarate reductase, cytochrome b subunit